MKLGVALESSAKSGAVLVPAFIAYPTNADVSSSEKVTVVTPLGGGTIWPYDPSTNAAISRTLVNGVPSGCGSTLSCVA